MTHSLYAKLDDGSSVPFFVEKLLVDHSSTIADFMRHKALIILPNTSMRLWGAGKQVYWHIPTKLKFREYIGGNVERSVMIKE